jgi:hypothetical protein
MTVFARSFLTGSFTRDQLRKVFFLCFALPREAGMKEKPLPESNEEA